MVCGVGGVVLIVDDDYDHDDDLQHWGCSIEHAAICVHYIGYG